MDGTTYSPTSVILRLSCSPAYLGSSISLEATQMDNYIHHILGERRDPLSKAGATLVDTPLEISSAIVGVMLNGDEEEGRK